MRRRQFITLVGGVVAPWPLAARAQQASMPVIGFVNSASPGGYPPLSAFLEGLGGAGFVEGRDVAIEYRWAEGHYERLPALLADLVQRKVNDASYTVVVPGVGADTFSTRNRDGFRHGLYCIGCCWALSLRQIKHVIDQAEQLHQRAGAFIIPTDPFFTGWHNELVALAVRYALPGSYPYRDYTIAGGLMSYGPNLADTYHLAGAYTGRILKGEKPADLPVQQSTKVEMIINLKTAKAFGITVPLPLLGRADEVIE